MLVVPQGNQHNQITGDTEGIFSEIAWYNVKVGQICKIRCDEYFPADMVLLNSDDPQGICYVETKNLDGETNMKHKMANKKTTFVTETEDDLARFEGKIECQGPNEYLYKFEGNMSFTPENENYMKDDQSYNGGPIQIPLDANQMLLRGSSLRNTEYIYGIVIYTGHESKIMKNSPESRNKLSGIERMTNKFILLTFSFQLVTCLFASIYSVVWNHHNRDSTEAYLRWSLSTAPEYTNVLVEFIISFCSWLLIFW